jgi:hypothetical protein
LLGQKEKEMQIRKDKNRTHRKPTLPTLAMTLITASLLAPFAFADNSTRALVTIDPPGSIDTRLLDLDMNGNITASTQTVTDLGGERHSLSWSNIQAISPPKADSPR